MPTNLNRRTFAAWRGYIDPRYQDWPRPLRLMARTCTRWLATDRPDAISLMAALHTLRARDLFKNGGRK